MIDLVEKILLIMKSLEELNKNLFLIDDILTEVRSIREELEKIRKTIKKYAK